MNLAYSRKCKICGKEIFPTYQWTYKDGRKYYCSWKCFNHRKGDEKPKEIIIPKVGDIIRIKYLAGIIDYYGRIGVVKKIDEMGQLHGTWGELVVVPSEDRFEIIGESEWK